MKIKEYLKNGLFVTIGGYSIDFPVGNKWVSLRNLFDDGLNLINILIGLGSVVAVAMMIVAGYTLITASGNPDKIEQGQKTLTAAIVGLVIVWVAGLAITFVLELLGI